MLEPNPEIRLGIPLPAYFVVSAHQTNGENALRGRGRDHRGLVVHGLPDHTPAHRQYADRCTRPREHQPVAFHDTCSCSPNASTRDSVGTTNDDTTDDCDIACLDTDRDRAGS